MMYRNAVASAIVALATWTCGANGDILVDNAPDFREYLHSMKMMDFVNVQTADDFVFHLPGTVTDVTVYFALTPNAVAGQWKLSLHADDEGKPADDDMATFTNGVAVDLGGYQGPHGTLWRMYRVSWDLGSIDVDPGRYWIVPSPTGTTGEGLANWISANTGHQRESCAQFLAPELGVTEWTTWQQYTYDCLPVDGTFVLEGTGGGLPAERNARLKNVTILRGDFLRGRWRSVNDADRDSVSLTSGPTRHGIQTIKFDLEFKVRSNDVEWLALKTSSRISQTAGSADYFIWNWDARRWERLAEMQLSRAMNYTEAYVESADFLREDGRVRIRVVAQAPPQDGGRYLLTIQQLRVDAFIPETSDG